MTHTFLERPELVPVVLTCVIKERIKEIVNRTMSVRKLLLTHGLAPDWWTSKFSEHNISYNLRDSENKLKAQIPRTIYFKNSFSYSGGIVQWPFLRGQMRGILRVVETRNQKSSLNYGIHEKQQYSVMNMINI